MDVGKPEYSRNNRFLAGERLLNNQR
jgi:hypothetical protein